MHTESGAPYLAHALKLEVGRIMKAADKMAAGNVASSSLLRNEEVPSTENHYLFDTLNKIRNDRLVAKIDALGPGEDTSTKEAVKAMLRSTIGDESNESQEVQDMIDYLSAYWKLAMKRYVDNVVQVVANTYTTQDVVSKMEAGVSDAMHDKDDDQLKQLFRQNPERERRRAELKSTLSIMRAAKERLRVAGVA